MRYTLGIMETRRLITLRSMAACLRVPAKWLREEALSGRIPCLRAGKAILVDPEAVEAELLRRAAASSGAVHERDSERAQRENNGLLQDSVAGTSGSSPVSTQVEGHGRC